MLPIFSTCLGGHFSSCYLSLSVFKVPNLILPLRTSRILDVGLLYSCRHQRIQREVIASALLTENPNTPACRYTWQTRCQNFGGLRGINDLENEMQCIEDLLLKMTLTGSLTDLFNESTAGNLTATGLFI